MIKIFLTLLIIISSSIIISCDNSTGSSSKIVIFKSETTTKGSFTNTEHQTWCDTAHTNLGINLSVVKPFISRDGVNIKDISGVPSDGKIKSPNGSVIAANWADLWNTGTALDMNLADAGILPADSYWYNGSNGDGTIETTTCSTWTIDDTSGNGYAGDSDLTDDKWIHGINLLCVNSAYVLCIGWEE